MTISYPAGLPHPLREGYGFEPENNILRTQMQSGRARQRRSFTSIPAYANLSWIFATQGQAQLFDAWAQQVAGPDWFTIPLNTPLGLEDHECRFLQSPVGPTRVGNRYWGFTARVELRNKPVLDAGYAEFVPDFVLNSCIFDYAMNFKWPLASPGPEPSVIINSFSIVAES